MDKYQQNQHHIWELESCYVYYELKKKKNVGTEKYGRAAQLQLKV
jgi:hypothetical protein